MEILKDAEFRKELKSTPRTGYFFFGEEDYLKAFALRQAREQLSPDPTLSFFNEIRIDALEYTPQKLLDALMPMPMMAEKKLVTLSGLNFLSMRANELEELCTVLEELPNYDYNTLIVYASADCFDPGILPKRPSGMLTRLSALLTPVHFERCTTAKLTAWIQKHFLHNEIQASPALCAHMAEYCGHSMFVLANEIDKLSFYLRYHGQTEASEETMRLVCTPAIEYDAFAFTNAIMAGHQETALAILSDYRFRRVDPLMILGDVIKVIYDMIGVYAMTREGVPNTEISGALKLHEFRVGLYQKSLRQTNEKRLKNALRACEVADGALKLSPKGYAPLEQLICSL
ncbi:MAG: DNA polymerase III subunit delta [Clostridia bacterium]|nr:DNA polymerase III subunit delta [Clostridia bacterium]